MPDSWEKLLEDILDLDEGLTTWEVEFICSIEEQRDRGGDAWEPSDKQLAVIEEIVERRL